MGKSGTPFHFDHINLQVSKILRIEGFDNLLKTAQCVLCIVRFLIQLLKPKRLLLQPLFL